ncbi:hypothetical protein WAE56_09295 [Iodobacter sp. LRB]|uniref:hypothetical protein n=1 Tax=unclassified Iodobacter TaxID=235634 RepID=UPI000C109D4B|nr:hypothetical protein [Iodobacter sp. BJB302]PHV01447.1 hypothetical protein CSQ88_11880 [Iodobacter sp. BJB302]
MALQELNRLQIETDASGRRIVSLPAAQMHALDVAAAFLIVSLELLNGNQRTCITKTSTVRIYI